MTLLATELVRDWLYFFEQIGVPSSALSGKHADCPICGSNEGFRTAIKNKPDGTWICKHCTSSKYKSGFDFVYSFTNSNSYKQAASFIYKQLENGGQVVRESKPRTENTTSKIDFTKEVSKRNWIWETIAREVTEGDPVWKYLHNRITGLKNIPKEIRYLPNAQYWDKNEENQSVCLGTFDAMLVRGFDKEENVVQLHTTYLTPTGQKANVKYPKKTKTSIGSNSYVFRLGEVSEDGEIGLAEGIETSLACTTRFGKPVWPCHSCSVLANFDIPIKYANKIKKITIYADNDGWRLRPDGSKWNPGLSKARELAERLRKQITAEGRRLSVVIAHTSQIGDFADK